MIKFMAAHNEYNQKDLSFLEDISLQEKGLITGFWLFSSESLFLDVVCNSSSEIVYRCPNYF